MRRMLGLAFVAVLFIALAFSVVSAACTDSDGGKEYYKKGTMTVDSTSYVDCCALADGSFCYGEGPKVNELFCDNGKFNQIQYECPNGCKDGACIPEERKCTDSDGGDIYKQGTVTNWGWGETKTDSCIIYQIGDTDAEGITLHNILAVDSCSGSRCYVEERICDGGMSTPGCPNGCKAGACLPYEQKEECIDTDNGENYYEKGASYSMNAGYWVREDDRCWAEQQGEGKPVYYTPPGKGMITLQGNVWDIEEYTCVAGNAIIKWGNCPNGCKDGACISVLLLVDDEGPPNDIVLMTDLAAWLTTKDKTSTAKLDTEVKREDLHSIISVYVYEKKFLVIVGKNSPNTDYAFAQEIKQQLESKGLSVCPIIKSDELDSSDDLKKSLCNQMPMTPENPIYDASTENSGVACGKTYKCSGGWLKWSCDLEYTGDYRCRTGDACINKGYEPYCTYTQKALNLGVDCGIGVTSKGTCRDATAPKIDNILKDVSSTSATITWDTDEPANSYIIELKDQKTKAVQKFELPGKYYLKHSTSFSGLNADNAYWFTIKAVDAAGNAREATNGFTTLKEELPDLTIESVIVTKDTENFVPTNSIILGEAIYFFVNVKNNGPGTLEIKTPMQFTDLCESNCEIMLDTSEDNLVLAPGENTRIYVGFILYEAEDFVGTHTYTLTVDRQNQIKEANELNNNYMFDIEVLGKTGKEEKCVDTDPEKDYYKAGYITYQTFVLWDQCGLRATTPDPVTGGLKLTEVSQCKDESNCVLFEAYCSPGNPVGSYGSEDVKCKYGCKEGACIQGEDLPNLVITDLEFEPANPKPNDKVTVIVHFKNIGSANAVVKANSKLIGVYFKGQLKYIYQYPAAVDWTIKPGDDPIAYLYDTGITDSKEGTYTVSAKINYDNKIKESNYADNTYKENLEFKRECLPDLMINSYSLVTKSYVLENQTFDIKVKASNNGCASAKYENEMEVEIFMNVGDAATVSGKKITLKNVGSATTNTPVIVDVDGVTETVTGTETVNGLKIRVVKTIYSTNAAERAAVLGIYRQKYSAVDADLFPGEKVRLPVDDKFRTITLVKAGKSEITVDVDGVQSKIDVIGGSATTINGVKITWIGGGPDAAILEIELPNWHIANINGNIVTRGQGPWDIPIVSYPEKNVFGDAITKDEPIPQNGGSFLTKKWMFAPNITGYRELTFKLDPDNIIKESDETNNELKQSVYVFTKEVNCNADFVLPIGGEAIIFGSTTISMDSSSQITMKKDFRNSNSLKDTKTIVAGETKDFLNGEYTLFYKSTDGTSATLQLTKCPMAMQAGALTPTITRTMLTGGVIANLIPELSWLRFLRRFN